MHFGITEKLTTDCVSLYNRPNASLISKVSEEIASENAENFRSRQPHCRFTPPPQGAPANIRIGYTLYCQKYWVNLHSNFCGGLRKTHLFCNRARISRSRSSKVVDFGTNRKGVSSAYATSY